MPQMVQTLLFIGFTLICKVCHSPVFTEKCTLPIVRISLTSSWDFVVNFTLSNCESNMEIKKFRNKYGLELIPASHEDIILGSLVWDPLIGKPKFVHPGMPEHIYNAFLDAKIISRNNWMKKINELNKEKIKSAHLADQVIHMEANVVSTLENPVIQELEHRFELKKISKFHFGNLQVKAMSNLSRIQIDNHLELLKKDRWKAYDGNIRRVFMITELYYGSIQLIVNRQFKTELDASVKQSDLQITEAVEFDGSVEYTFDHKMVPFAMRLEKVREFNG